MDPQSSGRQGAITARPFESQAYVSALELPDGILELALAPHEFRDDRIEV
jgi:hypothetical protein